MAIYRLFNFEIFVGFIPVILNSLHFLKKTWHLRENIVHIKVTFSEKLLIESYVFKV